MKLPFSASPAQSRQTKEQFAHPDSYLDYELGKAVQKLPPLYTRLVAVSLSLTVFGVIAWAAFNKIDEVVEAPGEIIPTEGVLPVKAVSSDMIQAVKVKDGDQVEKGDILVELNTAHLETEVSRLEEQVQLRRVDLNRANAAAAEGQEARIKEAQVEVARQQDHYKSALSEADMLCKFVGAISRLDCNRARDKVKDSQKNIAIQQQKIQQLKQDYQSVNMTQLSQLQNELSNVEGQLNQSRDLLKKQTITASVSGTVYNLKLNLGKGTLQAGEELLSILPEGKLPVLEVALPNHYMGFVDTRMKAKVKIKNFHYQGFGTIDGTVVYISPNTVPIGNNPGEKVFRTKIELEKHVVEVRRGEYIRITPGMPATGGIVIRKRTILSFLLDPITRQVDDVFSRK